MDKLAINKLEKALQDKFDLEDLEFEYDESDLELNWIEIDLYIEGENQGQINIFKEINSIICEGAIYSEKINIDNSKECLRGNYQYSSWSLKIEKL